MPSQTAFLEFFPAAAGTGIVAPDVVAGDRGGASQRDPIIPNRVLSLRGVFGLKPSQRTIRDRITERSEIAIGIKRLGFGMVDRVLQIFFEILECEPLGIDRLALKSLLYQRLQLGQSKPGHRVDPAAPDVAILLRLELRKAIAQEGRRRVARQLSSTRQHGDRLQHLGADELIGFGIANDLMERLGIAIENGRHHAMAGLGDASPRIVSRTSGGNRSKTANGQ